MKLFGYEYLVCPKTNDQRDKDPGHDVEGKIESCSTNMWYWQMDCKKHIDSEDDLANAPGLILFIFLKNRF